MHIKAIETSYKGYRFRSRLEARWAVFFDALGIKWEYEPEGFELPSGRYLPDFFLPGFSHPKGMFVEVKPVLPSELENTKARELAELSRCHVLMAVGTPDATDYCVWHCEEQRDPVTYQPLGTYDVDLSDCCFASKQLHNEYRVFWCSGYSEGDDYYLEFGVGEAIAAARSARFEFGESGARK